jgi:hypothetical protein
MHDCEVNGPLSMARTVLIGYARVSTDDRKPDLQRVALAAAGFEKVYEEKMSAAKSDRPPLMHLLRFACPGDTVGCYVAPRPSYRMWSRADDCGSDAMTAGRISPNPVRVAATVLRNLVRKSR